MSQVNLSVVQRCFSAAGSVEIHRFDVVRSGRMIPTFAPFPSIAVELPPAAEDEDEDEELPVPAEEEDPADVVDEPEPPELPPQADKASAPTAVTAATPNAPLRIEITFLRDVAPGKAATQIVVRCNISSIM